MKVFFSVVLPTFNRSNFITGAINSLLNQTYDDWELIIVDDGSTDNTKKVVEQFSKKDSRIKYHYQKNSERSAARNNGINKTKGNYICFIDSDDLYEEGYLNALHKFIQKNESKKGMFFCNVSRLENGVKEKVPHEALENYANEIEYILLSKETVIPARVCIHEEILKFNQFDETLNVSEDAELFTRILAKYPMIQFNYYGAIYNIHSDNTTNLKNNPFLGQLKSLNKITRNKSVRPLISNRTRKIKFSSCYFGIAKYHLMKKNMFLSRYYLILSIVKNIQAKSTKHKLYLLWKGRIS